MNVNWYQSMDGCFFQCHFLFGSENQYINNHSQMNWCIRSIIKRISCVLSSLAGLFQVNCYCDVIVIVAEWIMDVLFIHLLRKCYGSWDIACCMAVCEINKRTLITLIASNQSTHETQLPIRSISFQMKDFDVYRDKSTNYGRLKEIPSNE